MGQWGNFPGGPGMTSQPVTVRGVATSVTISPSQDTDGAPGYIVSWHGQGEFYSIRAFSFDLTPADIARIADSLTRVPPTAGGATDLGTLAYVQDGNLWVRALPDGTPREILDSGHASSPRWSPSGEWILAGDVVVRADGGEWRTAAGCLAWSPIADALACRDPGGLVLESADGAWRQPVPLDAVPQYVAWSPDGRRIAAAANRPAGPVPKQWASSLTVVDLPGLAETPVLHTDIKAGDGIVLVGWSDDGKDLLYFVDPAFSASIGADGLGLRAVAADGHGPPRTLVDAALTYPDLMDEIGKVSPFLLTAGPDRETWTNKRIAAVDAATGKVVDLTDASVAALEPAASPHGTEIAYASAPDIGRVGGGDPAHAGLNARRIWLMWPDGSHARQLTPDAGYRDERPLWSADGSAILFARFAASGDAASLWLMPSSGGGAVKVANLSLGADSGSSLAPGWFGFYGHTGWDEYCAWWRGPGATP